MSGQFNHLLRPLKIGNVTVRNRTVFTGHNSAHQNFDGTISDEYIGYQVARARGGAGLQILCAAAIDEYSSTDPGQLRIDADDVIPGLAKMADAVHEHGGKVFVQLLQAGREVYGMPDGTLPVTFSASATRSELTGVVPRQMSLQMIGEVIRAYAAAAQRAIDAGLDGVELVANQGNLPAQFLAGDVNCRSDQYGVNLDGRMRFLIEAATAIREVTKGKIAFGVRISASEMEDGVTDEESFAACRRLDELSLVDYLSVVVGAPSTRIGAYHVIPPMYEAAGYVSQYVLPIKRAVRVPVIATGRFNTPNLADEAIREGVADAIGMTRAMISDPDLANKVLAGRSEDVRACVGCLQACIGHLHKHAGVSCIQFPETGRETSLGQYGQAAQPRRVIVAGGGVAGMKAAAIAATRGHDVLLCEASGNLGGQVQLAQRLPGRAEFGGVITNLEREVFNAGVEVRRHVIVDRSLIKQERADVLIIATGGRPARPSDKISVEDMQVVTASEYLSGDAAVGKRVVVADRQSDWVGVGVAEKLALDGHFVRLAVTGAQPAETTPMFIRDYSAGRLFALGIETHCYARLCGADGEDVYFQHLLTQGPLILGGVDTLITCFGSAADTAVEQQVQGLEIEVHVIGDCLTPRTVEEAVLDGLRVGRLI